MCLSSGTCCHALLGGVGLGPRIGKPRCAHLDIHRCGFSGLTLNFAVPTASGENVCFPIFGEYQKLTATSGDYFEIICFTELWDGKLPIARY